MSQLTLTTSIGRNPERGTSSYILCEFIRAIMFINVEALGLVLNEGIACWNVDKTLFLVHRMSSSINVTLL